MQPQQVESQKFIRCPKCNKGVHVIQHILDDFAEGHRQSPFWTRWFCRESECGHGFSLEIHADGTVTTEPSGEERHETWVLLEIPPSDKPIHIIAHGLRFRPFDEEYKDRCRFHYEENTVVGNIFRDSHWVTDNTPIKMIDVYQTAEEAEAEFNKREDPNA